MDTSVVDPHVMLLRRTKAHIRELKRTRSAVQDQLPRLKRTYEEKIAALKEELKTTEAFAVNVGTKLSTMTAANAKSTRRVDALEKMLQLERDRAAEDLAAKSAEVKRLAEERDRWQRSYEVLHDKRNEGHESRPFLSSAPHLFGWAVLQPQRGRFGTSFAVQAICTGMVLVFVCWALSAVQTATHVRLLVTWSVLSPGVGAALWPVSVANLVHFYVPGVAVAAIVGAGAQYVSRERLKAMPVVAQCIACSLFLYAVLYQWVEVAAEAPFGEGEGVSAARPLELPPLWSCPLVGVATLYPAPLLILLRVLQRGPAWPELVNTSHRAAYALQWLAHSALASYTCAVTLKMLSALSHADVANTLLQRSTVGASVSILQRLFSDSWPSAAEALETVLLGWAPLAVASIVGLQVLYQLANQLAVWLHLWSQRDVSWTLKPVVPASILVVIHMCLALWYCYVTVALPNASSGLVSAAPLSPLEATLSPLLFTSAVGLARIVKAVSTPIDTDDEGW